jgi:DNA-binding NtrC family response regulator
VRAPGERFVTPGPLRLIVEHEGRQYHVDAPEGPAILGADPACDIHLPLPGISRRHAAVEPSARGLRLRDLGSKNGLVLGGVRLSAVELLPGDRLFLGKAELTLQRLAAADAVVSVALPRQRLAAGARDGSTESGGTPALAGAPPGLLEALREHSSRLAEDPQIAGAHLLERAAGSLDARHLFFVNRADGRAVAGRVLGLPAAAALIDVAGERARGVPDWSTRRFSSPGLPVAFLRSSDRTTGNLVAALVLDPPPAALDPWQEDLLDLLLRTVAHGQGLEKRPGDDSLVYPAGFVRTRSRAMSRLLADLRATVDSDLDVLLLGETGAGKEYLAEIVHASGPTRAGPFIPVNCAAIPGELLEAELFGVRARVATGVDPRSGLLIRARGGSVFLDEIGDMPLSLQAKLLRALEEREVWPLGSHEPEPIHVRVISSTNRDLPALVRHGQFRADLYYRLRGLEVHIPPLRQRPEDIAELAAHFAARAAAAYNKDVGGISARAMDLLLSHDWPGNVRELKTTVERAVLSCPNGALLGASAFEPSLRPRGGRSAPETLQPARTIPSPPAPQSVAPSVLGEQVRDLERRIISAALTRFDGNKSKAARHLGITRNGLALKMRRLGIPSTRDDQAP